MTQPSVEPLIVSTGSAAAEASMPLEPRRRRPGIKWGLSPFFGYLAAFFLVPTMILLLTAFQSARTGAITTSNLTASVHGQYLTGLRNSVEVSLIDAVAAAVAGLVLAQAIVTSRSVAFRRLVSSASAVLTNFGGLPLAFLFSYTLGNAGVLTMFLDRHLEVSLQRDLHFDLYSVTGVEFVYLYFLVPLMVLVITPALEGLKPQWQEASSNLGASRLQYWRFVALPVLAPSLVGAAALLFCASISAYATAAALTNGTLPLTPLQIGAVLSGNVLTGQENVGAALALDMMIAVVPLTVLYVAMQRKTTRWLQ